MHFKRNFLIIWTYKVDHRTPVQGQVKHENKEEMKPKREAWHGGAYLCFHYLGGGGRRMRSWNLSLVVSWVGGQLGYRRQPPSQKSSQNGKTKPFRLTKQKCGYCSAPGHSQTFQVPCSGAEADADACGLPAGCSCSVLSQLSLLLIFHPCGWCDVNLKFPSSPDAA